MTAANSTLMLTLELEQFRELRDIIYDKSGIFYAENKSYLLENRLGRRLNELGMSSFDEYIKFLKTQMGGSSEFHQIYNAVTINETFFFRYQAQLDAFRKKLLVPLIDERRKRGNKNLKIWSAAASSGEELYTLAIILHEELGAEMASWNLDVLGTDISHRALKLAEEAAYTKNSFRGSMTSAQKVKYFTPNGTAFHVNDLVKDIVKFRFLNLNDSFEIRKMINIDFVFCRNVMIYFDEEMKKRVLRSIYGALKHGGYFFLGEAESLHGVSSSFVVEHFSGAFAYKKE